MIARSLLILCALLLMAPLPGNYEHRLLLKSIDSPTDGVVIETQFEVVGEDDDPPPSANSISVVYPQLGMTVRGGGIATVRWDFTQAYPNGRYVDGEPWAQTVNGQVCIQSISPSFKKICHGGNHNDESCTGETFCDEGLAPEDVGDARCVGIHGYEVNPVVEDLPTGQTQWGATCNYSRGCDVQQLSGVGNRVSSQIFASPLNNNPLPKCFPAGTSIVKAIEVMEDGTVGCTTGVSCIGWMSVLTIVTDAPPPNSFRPPYNGTQKPTHLYDEAAFRAKLESRNYPLLPVRMESEDTALERIGALSVCYTGVGNTYAAWDFTTKSCYKGTDFRGYGATVANSNMGAALRSFFVGDIPKRLLMAREVTQRGIDAFYAWKNGGKNYDQRGGTITTGWVPTIFYAGWMLNSTSFLAYPEEISDEGRNHTYIGDTAVWSIDEDGCKDDPTIGDVLTCSEKLAGGQPQTDYYVEQTGDCDPPGTTYRCYVRYNTGQGCTQKRDMGQAKRGTVPLFNGSPEDVADCKPQPLVSTHLANGTWSTTDYQLMSHPRFCGGAVIRAMDIDGPLLPWDDPQSGALTDASKKGAFLKYLDRVSQAPWDYLDSNYGQSFCAEAYHSLMCGSVDCRTARGDDD